MKSSNIGGQAVLEGIMMRNGGKYSVAVRRTDGEIVVEDGRETSETPTAEQRLEEARNLYDRGLITKEEYEAKRAEILKEI